jgi:hypothetical protein
MRCPNLNRDRNHDENFQPKSGHPRDNPDSDPEKLLPLSLVGKGRGGEEPQYQRANFEQL